MKSALQPSARGNYSGVGIVILAVFLVVLTTYSYRLSHRYENQLNQLMTMEGQMKLVAREKEEQAQRNNECTVRARDLEELKRVAEEGRQSVEKEKQNCEAAKQKEKEEADAYKKKMDEFTKSIASLIGLDWITDLQPATDKLKEMAEKAKKVDYLEKKEKELKEQIANCSKESKS